MASAARADRRRAARDSAAAVLGKPDAVELTYWNGERCAARRVTVVVADDGRFPGYWARELVGTERPAVEVTYNGHIFYIDDENDEGWLKVTKGFGGPRYPHGSLAVSHVSALRAGPATVTFPRGQA